MQQCLALPRAAEQVAGLAMLLELADVTPDRLPALDLPPVFLRHAPAHVIAAVPLKPAARVVGMDPAFSLPFRQRLAGIDAEEIAVHGRSPRGESLALANQLLGNSFRQSVMYLPPKTPSASICAGVSCGLNSGSKSRPTGALQHVAIALLHLVVDGNRALAHQLLRQVRIFGMAFDIGLGERAYRVRP